MIARREFLALGAWTAAGCCVPAGWGAFPPAATAAEERLQRWLRAFAHGKPATWLATATAGDAAACRVRFADTTEISRAFACVCEHFDRVVALAGNTLALEAGGSRITVRLECA